MLYCLSEDCESDNVVVPALQIGSTDGDAECRFEGEELSRVG